MLCVAGSWIFSSPAAAALQLCNRTSYVLYTAVGIQKSTVILTRGWTRIAPGSCATPIAEPLNASAYFVYAYTSQAHSGPSRAWGGPFRLCVKDASFSLQMPVSATGCGADDAFLTPFAAVVRGAAKSWTTTFTESARIASLDDARLAGLDRLLADVGYKIVTGDAHGNKNRNDALSDFRAHQNLPNNAGAAALFAALESQAAKITAPTGYAVCNDGTSEIWAALGLKAGSDYVSRGWWAIAPGGCAKALTDALGPGKIYLFATKHGNNRLVSGPEMFCTTDVTFNIQGRERCPQRGLAETGFAATNLDGLPGVTVHIGNNGLSSGIPQLRQTPK